MPHVSRRLAAALLPVAVSLAVAAGGVQAVAQDEPATTLLGTEAPQPARGLIVKLDPAAERDVADLADEVRSELPDDVAVAGTDAASGELGLLELSEQVDAADLDDAIEQLEDQPDVEWAVPNGVRMPSATANDPGFGQQWNLRGTWGVRADSAWDVTTGSPSVRVAVIDTGVRSDHPDLRGRLVAGRDFVDDEYRCVDNACTKIRYRRTFQSANDGNAWDASPADPGDWRGASTCGYMGASRSTWHGTHVAGIVAATRNNGVGIAGVAPAVKVQPVRALGRCGGTDWDIAMSVLWAAGINVTAYDRRHGRIPVNRTPAKVINLSLGAVTNTLREARQACRLYGMVARKARARGALVVAAAGNNGYDHRYNVPSSCSGYLSVAATTPTGEQAFYSNEGAGVDVAAPGGSGPASPSRENILSTWNNGATRPGANVYGTMAGTSMAAPAVAGVAALGQSVGITNPVVLERVLRATARRGSCSVRACGSGIVDAAGVVNAKAPLSAPRISGLARPGGTLSATPGRWRNTSSVQLTWYRGSTAVASGRTYRPTQADLGREITVRTRAAGGDRAIFHQASVVVRTPSRTAFSMPRTVKESQRATVRVRVTAPYVRATGTVRVYGGKRRIAVKRLYAKDRGTVSIRLPKLKKGRHAIRVVYSGSAKVSASSRGAVVRSR
ncbi:S8 family serine peptidase [Aeromicrobium sp. 179-A 4D2 NHS]|uniref:S8 family serine peptidase n=1 Tax=Aeromicrobium sp. 179-A 4D2 NHS TaxID=3142375 RepID=UPI0039A32D53